MLCKEQNGTVLFSFICLFVFCRQSLKDVKKMSEGVHQVLNLQPSAETLDAYRDVFSGPDGKLSEPAHGHGIRRAASEREYSVECVPLTPPTPQQ